MFQRKVYFGYVKLFQFYETVSLRITQYFPVTVTHLIDVLYLNNIRGQFSTPLVLACVSCEYYLNDNKDGIYSIVLSVGTGMFFKKVQEQVVSVAVWITIFFLDFRAFVHTNDYG